jgi:lysyl-tRNA synthetase class 2
MNPSALRGRLATRDRALARIRAFFADRGVFEVATPALSPAATTDPALASLKLDVQSLAGVHYLHTSPEYAMKRLLADGSGDIYQLARVFRDGELGRWHQPEFQLLEWYRLGFDEFDLMHEVYELLRVVLEPELPRLARLDLSYAQAFIATLAVDPLHFDAAGSARLTAALAERGIDVPAGLAHAELLDLALTTAIVPAWPQGTVVFLYDYPADQAALAAIKPGEPPVAARFEVFLNGLELGNGFRELTDATEQRQRFAADLSRRRAGGLPEPPIDEAFLAALEKGLPDCAGIALGVDRLIALLTGARTLADVVNLPHQQPQKKGSEPF